MTHFFILSDKTSFFMFYFKWQNCWSSWLGLGERKKWKRKKGWLSPGNWGSSNPQGGIFCPRFSGSTIEPGDYIISSWYELRTKTISSDQHFTVFRFGSTAAWSKPDSDSRNTGNSRLSVHCYRYIFWSFKCAAILWYFHWNLWTWKPKAIGIDYWTYFPTVLTC